MEYRDLGQTGMRVSEISLAADMPPLSEEVMQRAREIYDDHVRQEVHHRW